MVFSIIYGRIRSDITHLIVASEFLRFSYHTKFDAKAFIADVFNRKNLYEKFPSAYQSSPINVLLPDPVYVCLLQPPELRHLWPVMAMLAALGVRHYRVWPCLQAHLSPPLTGFGPTFTSPQAPPAMAGSLWSQGTLSRDPPPAVPPA